MNRNTSMLQLVLLVAALFTWGCGGGESPQATDQPQPSADAGDSGNTEDQASPDINQPDAVCATALHTACEPCSPEGDKDPCSSLECIDGMWQDPQVSSKPCINQDAGEDVDAGTDAEPDSGEDAGEDAEPDADQPDTGEEADAPLPTEECNGLDDDGDQEVDEDFECVQGSDDVACATSCDPAGVKSGTQSCNNDCSLSACQPPSEVCSGLNDTDDEDCDGKAGCEDPDCFGESFCQPSEICDNQIDDDGDNDVDCLDSDCEGFSACEEVCDGQDNNQNGQIDENQECAQGSPPVECDTTCGSKGESPCQANCTYGACIPPLETCNGLDDDCVGGADNGFACTQFADLGTCTTSCGSVGTHSCDATCNPGQCNPPATETSCDDNIDDDCDGDIDCADLDCEQAAACQPPQHNFGDCPDPGLPTKDMSCSWTRDVEPSGWDIVTDACANTLGDHWVGGGTNNEWRVAHNTSGNVWSEQGLPIAGDPTLGIASVVCTGSDVYTVYTTAGDNGSGTFGVVFLRWNGSGWVQSGASFLSERLAQAAWGIGSNVWIIAHAGFHSDQKLLKWDGSSFTETSLPSYSPNQLIVTDMWGSGLNDVYIVGKEYDPNDANNEAKHKAAMLHWDGSTWLKMMIPSEAKLFEHIDGSSSCDAMAVGWDYSETSYSYGRVGNSWQLMTYDGFNSIAGVAKKSATEYILQGDEIVGSAGKVWIGTTKSDGLLDWNYEDPDNFWRADIAAYVPGSSLYIMAGHGFYGGMIYRSTCN